MSQRIISRINTKLKIPNLHRVLSERLSFSELQSLLLKVFELKSKRKNSSKLFVEFKKNRFVQPSDINPILRRKLELAIFSILPSDFEIIDLSQLVPLGLSSILTGIHQNNVISSIRNSEVAADTTNILALECAKRREIFLKNNKKSNELIKLCSCQQVVRAQPYENENFSPHFNLSALCTAGRDIGNNSFEINSLKDHIHFYIRLIKHIVEIDEIKSVNIKFFNFAGFNNSDLIEKVKKDFKPYEKLKFTIEDDSEFGKNYYSKMRFMISIKNQEDAEFDYIDGGFTTWTAHLLNNKKEQLLTSGIGTDFLLRTIKTRNL